MAINLGKDPNILILISFAEILFIIVPSFIAAKIEKIPFIVEVKDFGFNVKNPKLKNIILKIFAGILIGIFFFFISDLLLPFYIRFVIQNLFGRQFIEEGVENAITTAPFNPTITQLIIIITIQIIIVGPCEEGFFRGFIIKRSQKKMKLIYSVVLSTFIFALYHVPPFLVPVSTIITFFGYFFTLGTLLALTFVFFKNSLLPGSIAHSMFNILILIL
jgi:membrane protease YdiL (CAAX protease family)